MDGCSSGLEAWRPGAQNTEDTVVEVSEWGCSFTAHILDVRVLIACKHSSFLKILNSKNDVRIDFITSFCVSIGGFKERSVTNVSFFSHVKLTLKLN